MANSQTASSSADTFAVALEGELVHCDCMNDAVAIKNANHVLSNHAEHHYDWHEVEKMAEIAERYGRHLESESLKRHCAQMRAAQFLYDKTGYQRPLRLPQS